MTEGFLLGIASIAIALIGFSGVVIALVGVAKANGRRLRCCN